MRRREEVRGEDDARRMRDAAGDSIVLRWCSHRYICCVHGCRMTLVVDARSSRLAMSQHRWGQSRKAEVKCYDAPRLKAGIAS